MRGRRVPLSLPRRLLTDLSHLARGFPRATLLTRISLPTMLVGFARYSRDRSFAVLGENLRFVLVMAAGSIVGSFIGSRLLGLVPNTVLLPLLAVVLVLSAVKVWRHK